MFSQFLLLGLVLPFCCAAAGLSGRVVDAQTNAPLTNVTIIVVGTSVSILTASDGSFSIPESVSGELEVLISCSGYGVQRFRLTLNSSTETKVEIKLTRADRIIIEDLTIISNSEYEAERGTVSSAAITQRDLNSVTSVLLTDPVRAVSSLPGTVASDDLNSRFSLRGAGMRRLGFFVDEVLIDAPAHAVQEGQGGGSVSVLSAAITESIRLLPGTSPVSYGNSTAGVLSFETRAGSRDKFSGQVTASLLNSSATADGPLPNRRGSWLITGRRSYLNYILHRLNRPGVAFDFTDIQGKVVVEPDDRQQIALTAVLGHSKASRTNHPLLEHNVADSQRNKGNNHLLIASWHYTPRNWLDLRARLFNVNGSFVNTNAVNTQVERNSLRQTGLRGDAIVQVNSNHLLETGLYLRDLQGTGFKQVQSLPTAKQLVPLFDFQRRMRQSAVYLEDTWRLIPVTASLTGGVRVERSNHNGETVVLPRLALQMRLSERDQINFGWSNHAQFPDFARLFGFSGNPQLQAERAEHLNLSFKHRFGETTRFVAEVYQRKDRYLIFSLAEDAARSDQLLTTLPVFRNILSGYARGVEVSIQKNAGRYLTGTASYSYSVTQQRTLEHNLRFISDFDQRHTLSASGTYRLNPTLYLNAQWRFGSGLPRVGFFRDLHSEQDWQMLRNQIRLPAYNRLDLSVSQSFQLKRIEMTITGEVLNALGRDNLRQEKGGLARSLPFVPSIGFQLRF